MLHERLIWFSKEVPKVVCWDLEYLMILLGLKRVNYIKFIISSLIEPNFMYVYDIYTYFVFIRFIVFI